MSEGEMSEQQKSLRPDDLLWFEMPAPGRILEVDYVSVDGFEAPSPLEAAFATEPQRSIIDTALKKLGTA